MRGQVKWYSESKGYGFLERTPGEPVERNVFVHYTAIQGDGYLTLSEGETVEFELIEGPKGPQAANVVRGALK